MKSMTKILFNLPNILNHRVGLQENYPLSPHHNLISSIAERLTANEYS